MKTEKLLKPSLAGENISMGWWYFSGNAPSRLESKAAVYVNKYFLPTIPTLKLILFEVIIYYQVNAFNISHELLGTFKKCSDCVINQK